MVLSDSSRVLAAILILSLVTVELGGVFVLLIVGGRRVATPLQLTFFRAGHAHAGVLLILGLVAQVLVDATTLTGVWEWVARALIPIAALLLPGGFFLSVARSGATSANRLKILIPTGAVVLAIGLVTLGVGLLAG
ncbi:MAG: hypothetical protein L0H79_16075 [Intrasporangium sp.]|uniref:hypothetical protein n=1 Tax=Intrasporangium sp. TaxID=1925024 RepID=UPI002648026E|nr:hypothetical protein [Intrasporangium sp.]MDN5797254.1 hypothetical protein [Intrasporangium sp.]